jgi:ketosteroid isomerase-like protein
VGKGALAPCPHLTSCLIDRWWARREGRSFAERPRTVAFNFIADGDYVAVEARGDNVTKTGQRYDNQYCMIWRIENGKIKQIKEYCDSTLVERVLGPFPEARKLAS